MTALMATKPDYVMGFEKRNGHILVDALINGVAATLILDTGSSILSLDRDWAAALSLPSAGEPIQIQGSADVTVSLATVSRVQLGGLALANETAALIPLSQVSAAHGKRVHGTIGFSLFSLYVVEIDYAGEQLRLFDPSHYSYEGDGNVLSIDVSRRIPIVAARVKPTGRDAIDARLALDLGTAGSAVLFTVPFVARHAQDFAKSRTIEAPSGEGVGGAASIRATRLESLWLGDMSFARPTAMLAQTGGGFLSVDWADGTMGAPIYERMTVIFDYSRSRVILEPTSALGQPFEYDASGLGLKAVPPDYETVRVAFVANDSPASAAGIHVGDELVALDGFPVSGRNVDMIRRMLRVGGETRELTLGRSGGQVRVQVALSSLLP
jgi:hypothetical protein